MNLHQALESVRPLDREAMSRARARLDSLTKPLGSLGRLEELVVQIAGINGTPFPRADKKTVVIMCADNGVTAEGVSSCPKSVTASVMLNFTRGITGINVLSRHAGADIVVVDVGVDACIESKGIVGKKIGMGTRNMAEGPAMTREEALRGIETGIDIVAGLKRKGTHLLGTGEMGIGNTTTSSAVAAVLTGKPLETLVGKGSGLSREGLAKKREVVRRASEINSPDPGDPLDVLSKLGGFDIAGLAGCFIGAAAHRIPVVIDGFISSAAALVAAAIKPEARDFMLPSHGSAEPGSAAVLEALGFRPMLDLGMRLGEGTGAALAFLLIDAALAAYTEMGTFDDAAIEQYQPLE
jgi:nicotinate-nucleotide--dimethylbenzimidazole phosphoribosyltransferase